jgi:hypothetical protein
MARLPLTRGGIVPASGQLVKVIRRTTKKRAASSRLSATAGLTSSAPGARRPIYSDCFYRFDLANRVNFSGQNESADDRPSSSPLTTRLPVDYAGDDG